MTPRFASSFAFHQTTLEPFSSSFRNQNVKSVVSAVPAEVAINYTKHDKKSFNLFKRDIQLSIQMQHICYEILRHWKIGVLPNYTIWCLAFRQRVKLLCQTSTLPQLTNLLVLHNSKQWYNGTFILNKVNIL